MVIYISWYESYGFLIGEVKAFLFTNTVPYGHLDLMNKFKDVPKLLIINS